MKKKDKKLDFLPEAKVVQARKSLCYRKETQHFSRLKPGFHLDILFLPFVARFGFLYQQKTKTSNAIFTWKHLQKNQNEQPEAFACFGF